MFSARVSSPHARSEEPRTGRWLRLVRGSSREPDRLLADRTFQTVLSVGSDVSCDWQIVAEDVPALALWMRASPGGLLVRAAPACPVSIDGQLLGSLWTPAASGSRISVGGAAFEVGLSGRSRRAQRERLQRVCERVPDGFGAPLASCGAGAPAPDAAVALGDSWLAEAEPEEPPIATIFEANDIGGDRAPSLRSRTRRKAKLRLAATIGIAGGLLTCAYCFWVLLLDRL